MYADTVVVEIHDTKGQWEFIEQEVFVKNGRIEVGFRASSDTGGRLLVDDVSLVRVM